MGVRAHRISPLVTVQNGRTRLPTAGACPVLLRTIPVACRLTRDKIVAISHQICRQNEYSAQYMCASPKYC